MMTEAEAELLRLFDEAKAKLKQVLSPGDAEPEMAAFISAVQMNPNSRSFVKEMFSKELERPGTAWEFLQFCFHALRWPEMQDYVRAGLDRDISNLRARAVWSHLLESFDPEWADAEFYQAFSTDNAASSRVRT